MRSGVPNFCCLSLALLECGYEAKGIIVDSKWLESLSYQVRAFFREYSEKAKVDTSKTEYFINRFGE